MKKKGGVRSREDTCGGPCRLLVQICIAKNNLWEEKKRIGSLASHHGILDDEFEELLDSGKLDKV